MMITLTYKPLAHSDFNSLHCLHWGLLTKAGWSVKYSNPIGNAMCGVSATKRFHSLSTAICEFEDITQCNLNLQAKYFAEGRGQIAGKILKKRMQGPNYIHRFQITNEAGEKQMLSGPDVVRQIKSRFV